MNTLLYIIVLAPFIIPAVIVGLFTAAYIIFADDKGDPLDDLAMYDE